MRNRKGEKSKFHVLLSSQGWDIETSCWFIAALRETSTCAIKNQQNLWHNWFYEWLVCLFLTLKKTFCNRNPLVLVRWPISGQRQWSFSTFEILEQRYFQKTKCILFSMKGSKYNYIDIGNIIELLLHFNIIITACIHLTVIRLEYLKWIMKNENAEHRNIICY